ncbi:S8 family serine peptidase [Streptacidiphilus anmyonensis]|uniref:S8 family serine peptidase n=1 Tax=Streptacidiphilus anmyonensis TaxID=405782 RepID=UPI001364CAA8|nr:S8 family serine peptidase [Streptacidiphilus anmyonensis]
MRDAQWALSTYEAAKAVWPHSTGKGVVVAVIDSGVRATHVDLRGQVLPGTDFVFGGNGQTDHSPEGHGTGMASIIAGRGHGPGGEEGIMGLAPGAKILPIGVGGGVGVVRGNYVPQAIRYAVDHGAQVISMSIGSAGADPEEESAVAYAEQHDVVLVAAAGNGGTSVKEYPASWPGVIKVGAVDSAGKLAGDSQTGGITVVAPGVAILRDGGASDTQTLQGDGTSDSTAYVAAIAALYRSAHPDLSAGQIVDYVIKTAVPPKGVTTPDPRYGYGIATPDLTMAVSPGPVSGPLPQASDPLKGARTTEADSAFSPSGHSLVIDIGGLAVFVLLANVVPVVVRNRRRGGGGGEGEPGVPGEMGEPAE